MNIIIRFAILAMTLTSLVQGDDLPFEESFKSVYNNYKQCESETEMIPCLKVKALKLMDRALSINTIPILDGMVLTKKDEGQRSISDTVPTKPFDEESLPTNRQERDKKLDSALWAKVEELFQTRSLQFKMDKLFFGDDEHEQNGKDGAVSGRKKKNRGMYMYILMMKGGMIALAYKALALLASKALIVSKIALTLALIVAIKKLFSSGHHTQKTTYEIVKTPVVTHSHQFSGSAPQSGHYGNEVSSYEGGAYARSLKSPTEEAIRRAGSKPVEFQSPVKYVKRIAETVEGRSLSSRSRSHVNSPSPSGAVQSKDAAAYNLPYAHMMAYKSQPTRNDGGGKSNSA